MWQLTQDPIETAETLTTGSNLISSLDYAARLLDPDKIIANLSKHSIETMGRALSVPNINFLLDNDGDGISNDIDSDDDGDGFADIADSNPYRFDIYLTPQTFTTTQGTAIKLNLQFSKPEKNFKNLILIEIDRNPSFGTITNNYPNIAYTPNPNYIGTDSFDYHVVYGTSYAAILNSDITTVTINITGP